MRFVAKGIVARQREEDHGKDPSFHIPHALEKDTREREIEPIG